MELLISLIMKILSPIMIYQMGKMNGKKESENDFLKDKIEELNILSDRMKEKREIIDEVNKMDRDSIYNSF